MGEYSEKPGWLKQKIRQWVILHDWVYFPLKYSQRFPWKQVRRFFRERYIKKMFGELKVKVNHPPVGRPVIIETTSVCNTNCFFCPHENMKREKMHMPDDIFNKSVEEIKKMGLRDIGLCNFGEPLVDPKIVERVRIVKKNYDCSVHIITNALALSNDVAEGLIDAGLDKLTVSLDAVDKDSFKKIRLGSYEKVVSNIKNLMELKKKKNADNPFVCVRFMVSKDNKKDARRFIWMWKNIVDEVAFGRIHDFYHGGQHLLNAPCLFLWESLVILSNGDVTVCCVDYEGKLFVGNIMEKSLWEIWNSEEIQRLRKWHLSGDYPAMCEHCDVNDSLVVKWWNYD